MEEAKPKKFIKLLAKRLGSDGSEKDTSVKPKRLLKEAVASLPEGPLKTAINERFGFYVKKLKLPDKTKVPAELNKKHKFPYNLYIKKKHPVTGNVEDDQTQQIYGTLLCRKLEVDPVETLIGLLAKIDEERKDSVLLNLTCGITSYLGLLKMMHLYFLIVQPKAESTITDHVGNMGKKKKKKKKTDDTTMCRTLCDQVKNFLSVCHLRHSTIQKPETPVYLYSYWDLQSSIVAVFIDLYLLTNRKSNKQEQASRRLCNVACYLTEDNPSFRLDALVQMSKVHTDIDLLLPYVRRTFEKKPVTGDIQHYLKYVLALRTVCDITSDKEESSEMNNLRRQTGRTVPAPKHFLDWLMKNNENILDEMPVEDRRFKGSSVTRFILEEADDTLLLLLTDTLTHSDVETEDQGSNKNKAAKKKRKTEETKEKTGEEETPNSELFFLDTGGSKQDEDAKKKDKVSKMENQVSKKKDKASKKERKESKETMGQENTPDSQLFFLDTGGSKQDQDTKMEDQFPKKKDKTSKKKRKESNKQKDVLIRKQCLEEVQTQRQQYKARKEQILQNTPKKEQKAVLKKLKEEQVHKLNILGEQYTASMAEVLQQQSDQDTKMEDQVSKKKDQVSKKKRKESNEAPDTKTEDQVSKKKKKTSKKEKKESKEDQDTKMEDPVPKKKSEKKKRKESEKTNGLENQQDSQLFFLDTVGSNQKQDQDTKLEKKVSTKKDKASKKKSKESEETITIPEENQETEVFVIDTAGSRHQQDDIDIEDTTESDDSVEITDVTFSEHTVVESSDEEEIEADEMDLRDMEEDELDNLDDDESDMEVGNESGDEDNKEGKKETEPRNERSDKETKEGKMDTEPYKDILCNDTDSEEDVLYISEDIDRKDDVDITTYTVKYVGDKDADLGEVDEDDVLKPEETNNDESDEVIVESDAEENDVMDTFEAKTDQEQTEEMLACFVNKSPRESQEEDSDEGEVTLSTPGQKRAGRLPVPELPVSGRSTRQRKVLKNSLDTTGASQSSGEQQTFTPTKTPTIGKKETTDQHTSGQSHQSLGIKETPLSRRNRASATSPEKQSVMLPRNTSPEKRSSVATPGSTSPVKRSSVATPTNAAPEKQSVTSPRNTSSEKISSVITPASTSPVKRSSVATPASTSPVKRSSVVTPGSTSPEKRSSVVTPGSTSPVKRSSVATPTIAAPEKRLFEDMIDFSSEEDKEDNVLSLRKRVKAEVSKKIEGITPGKRRNGDVELTNGACSGEVSARTSPRKSRAATFKTPDQRERTGGANSARKSKQKKDIYDFGSDEEIIIKTLEKKQKTESDGLKSPKAESDMLKTPKTESNRLKTPKTESNRLKTPKTESDRLKTPKTESNKLKTPKTESDRLKTPKTESDSLKTPKMESDRLKTPKTESSKLKTPKTESNKLKTPKTESNRLKTPKTESDRLKTPKTESNWLKTPKTESDKLKTPRMESDRLKTPKTESNRLKTPKRNKDENKSAPNASNVVLGGIENEVVPDSNDSDDDSTCEKSFPLLNSPVKENYKVRSSSNKTLRTRQALATADYVDTPRPRRSMGTLSQTSAEKFTSVKSRNSDPSSAIIDKHSPVQGQTNRRKSHSSADSIVASNGVDTAVSELTTANLATLASSDQRYSLRATRQRRLSETCEGCEPSTPTRSRRSVSGDVDPAMGSTKRRSMAGNAEPSSVNGSRLQTLDEDLMVTDTDTEASFSIKEAQTKSSRRKSTLSTSVESPRKSERRRCSLRGKN